MSEFITTPVDGSPYQPGQQVRVIDAIDITPPFVDVSEYIGLFGVVDYLEYSCGCGQSFPGDPMIGVSFPDGRQQEFWSEELAPSA
mgnify:CR=1 FL=1|jgi:hypothetical protein